jgi:PAS domain S-box-containing protein
MSHTPPLSQADLLGIIQENVHDLIAVINAHRERIWFNDAYCTTLGYTRMELESGDSTASLHPEDMESIRQSFEEAMASGRGRGLQYRMRHRDGHWIWLESRSRVIDHLPGVGKCVILVARNITRRKEQEAMQAAREQRVRMQKQALMELTQAPELQCEDADHIIRTVTQRVLASLEVQEVVVWWRTGETWERRAVLQKTMEGGEASAHQTRDSERPGLSGMEIPLMREGQRVGRMVCMDADQAREWHADEQAFAETLGAILMQALEAQSRRVAYAALEISQAKLSAELAEASRYVQALLPAPMDGTPAARWIFVPSEQLGGDALGYHWIDADHLALYVLDVCGHGVGAALLSISALNVIRSNAMPGIDCRSPAQVMRGLNHVFQMEKHNNMYFTLWYGVWNRVTRELVCCAGGHPSALLFVDGDEAPIHTLGRPGMVIGAWADAPYQEQRIHMPSGAHLLIFSDGAYEITQPDQSIWTHGQFAALARAHLLQPGADLDGLISKLRAIGSSAALEDDCTLLHLRF